MIKKVAVCDVCRKDLGEIDAWGEKYYELKTEGFNIRVDMSNRYFNAMDAPVHLCSAVCLRTYANRIIVDVTDRVNDVVDKAIQYAPKECDKEVEEAWDTNILVSTECNDDGGNKGMDTSTI